MNYVELFKHIHLLRLIKIANKYLQTMFSEYSKRQKPMNSVIEMLKVRDMNFALATKNILQSMIFVLDGITEFFDLVEDAKKGKISWEHIAMGQDEESNTMLAFVLVVSRLPGETISMPNGGFVLVTEETQQLFRRMIRVLIPANIVIQGSKEEIKKFLTKTMEEQTKAQQTAERMQEQSIQAIVQQGTGEEQPFDLDALTEEQKTSLLFHMSNANTSGTKN